MLNKKRILIGIGGGIAVYRVAELVRMLIKQEAEVRCVMTKSACEFVTPLTFDALTGEQTHTALFDLTKRGDNSAGKPNWTDKGRRKTGRGKEAEHQMGHIQLARWADAIVIAPATANLLTKLAYGIADDLLTTIMQVNSSPVLIAPAMNHSMWESDATKTNVATLLERDFHFSGPASGELACGEIGPGRLNEPEAILDDLLPLLQEQTLSGQKWVINAGPTWESWDSVRLLTNRASGTLGSLLADTASALGASVTLIAGPGTPACSERVQRVDVKSAAEMFSASLENAKNTNLFIGTAAVSDFSFKNKSSEKLKRGDTKQMQVELTANPDIVANVAEMDARPDKVVAFAAESSNHVKRAREKLVRKGVDAIFANDVSNMGSTDASGFWVTAKQTYEICALPKERLAEKIIEQIMEFQE